MRKQFIKELAAFSLFLISILWLLGTAGASDLGKISLGQCIWRLGIGVTGLYISTRIINGLSGKEGSNGEKDRDQPGGTS